MQKYIIVTSMTGFWGKEEYRFTFKIMFYIYWTIFWA